MLKKLLTVCALLFSTLSFAAVDVNKANELELTQIKGIGPAIAGRIVQARKLGPFKSWDDLIERVSGVAAPSAKKFSDAGLTLDGQGFKTGIAAPSGTTMTSTAAPASPKVAPSGVTDKSVNPSQKTGKTQ